MPAAVVDQVLAGDLEVVRAAVKDMPEVDRRRLARSAIRLLRDVTDHTYFDRDTPPELAEAYIKHNRGKVWPYQGERARVRECAEVLMLATVTPAEFRKFGGGFLPSDELALETLINRSTDLEGFVDAIADDTPRRWNSHFRLMRSLVQAGRIGSPANPGYILHMINAFGGRHTTIYDDLKADSTGLFEHEVWRLFEAEGGGEASLAAHDKYSPDARTWSSALARLCAEGQLPRGRLLDASLAALRRDFTAFRAGWFSRFHERLEPTKEERRERTPAYVALLSSSVPATVSFAVRALALAGGVPDQAIDRLRPALEAKTIATVKAAIKLLPSSRQGALLAADALARASRGSQPELLAFLEHVGDLDPEVRDALARAVANIAPSLRQPLQRWLGPQALPPKTSPIAPVAPEPGTVTELAPPVEAVPELVELLVGLLERVEQAHDLERAIDGVSRLCDRTDETLRWLEPVARRARKVLANSEAFRGMSPREDIAGLVLAWATGEARELPPLDVAAAKGASSWIRGSVLGFLSYRVLEVAVRAASGTRQPMLSLPTAPGGAIDPSVLASRRREHARLEIQAGRADALQAALRAGEISLPERFRFEYGSKVETRSYQGKTYKQIRFYVRVDPPLSDEPRLDRVPELFLAALGDGWTPASPRDAEYCGAWARGPAGLSEAVRWVATVWPANREPYYAGGAAEIGQNSEWWQARWHARHFLEPLLLPTEPIGEMARLLLAVGLGAKEAGERTLATDVLVTVVREDRLDGVALARTLARLYDGQVMSGSRLAASLADAGRVSRQHAEAMVTIIEHALASLQGPPRADLHALLGALSDLLATAGRGLQIAGARNYLSGLDGSGKAAALAKSLTSTAPVETTRQGGGGGRDLSRGRPG